MAASTWETEAPSPGLTGQAHIRTRNTGAGSQPGKR